MYDKRFERSSDTLKQVYKQWRFDKDAGSIISRSINANHGRSKMQKREITNHPTSSRDYSSQPGWELWHLLLSPTHLWIEHWTPGSVREQNNLHSTVHMC